jgi:hypothetical protein
MRTRSPEPEWGQPIASRPVRDADSEPTPLPTVPASGVPASGLPAPAVVVTGAAGWLGQNLVRALVSQPARQRIR